MTQCNQCVAGNGTDTLQINSGLVGIGDESDDRFWRTGEDIAGLILGEQGDVWV